MEKISNMTKTKYGNYDCSVDTPEGHFITEKKWERRAKKIGLTVVGDAFMGYKQRGKFFSPIIKILVQGDEGNLLESIAADSAKRAKQAKKSRTKTQQKIDDICSLVGCLPDSRCLRWYMAGQISLEEAQKIAEKTTHRHENTDYDDLLRRGIDRESARDMIR